MRSVPLSSADVLGSRPRKGGRVTPGCRTAAPVYAPISGVRGSGPKARFGRFRRFGGSSWRLVGLPWAVRGPWVSGSLRFAIGLTTGRQGHFPPTASPAPSAASQRIAPRGQPGPRGKSGLNVTERYLSLAAPRDGAASLRSPVRCPVRWQRH